MAAARIKDVDKGYKALFRRLNSEAYITVGIHSDRGADQLPGGVTVADVMTWAEYGLGQPERSWLRAWVEEQKGDIEKAMVALGREVVKGPLEADVAAEQLGAALKAMVQERIANHIDPPNADSTIASKGSSTPLIDTGQSRSAIDYKVNKAKKRAA